jgi:hypothetical protein
VVRVEGVDDGFIDKHLTAFEREQDGINVVRSDITLEGRPAWSAVRTYPNGGWETRIVTTHRPGWALVISCVDQLATSQSEWCADAVLEAVREEPPADKLGQQPRPSEGPKR